MDALSDILNSLRLKAVVYRKLTVTAKPWGIEMPKDESSQFWLLLKGACVVRMPGMESFSMKEGEFVFVPHGGAHSISGDRRTSCMPSMAYRKALDAGKRPFMGKEEETLMIGGHFEYGPGMKHPFLESLPPVIRIPDAEEIGAWLQHAGPFQGDAEKAGSQVILGRLAEVVFILIIRTYLETEKVEGGFLAALKDPRISGSLHELQSSPEKEWTLDQLATKAGMSRTLYAREFKRLVRQTPLAYLTQWRILRSQDLLLASTRNISEIAEEVGYQSEAAFNRLFKAKTGDTPASFRRKMKNSATG